MEKKEVSHKEEQNAIILNLIMEAVNYGAVIVSLVLTFSLAMLMDTLVSTCAFLRISICFFLNKKIQKNLKFSYNYGTDRLESLVALFCDGLMILGSLFVVGACVYQILIPRKVSDLILVAVIFKLICVIIDFVIIIPEYSAYKKTGTKLAKNVFEGMLASLLLDAGIFLGVLLSMILKGWAYVGFVEPVLSILICIFVTLKAIGRIKVGVGELSDLTLDEDSQIKILKVVSSHFSEFENLSDISSHRFGQKVFIDLEFSFPQDSTYADIKAFLKDLSSELKREFPENTITLRISND